LSAIRREVVMNTVDTVLGFFDKFGGVPGDTPQVKLACAYLDAQIIDSMGIVEMVSELEEKFGIRFQTEDLQADEFQTVGGLVATIDRLRAAAGR
jgi:acyl carrier protein